MTSKIIITSTLLVFTQITCMELATTQESSAIQLIGHPNSVNCIKWSPNEKLIASGGTHIHYDQGNNVFIWNTQSGKPVHQLQLPCGVNAIDWSPCGKKLIAGGTKQKDNLFIINAQTGTITHNLVGHSDCVNAVAWSPNGHYIISGCNNNFISPQGNNNALIWNALTGNVIHILSGHPDNITKVAWSFDGTYAKTSDRNNDLVWNTQTGKQETLQIPDAQFSSYDSCYSPDGTFAIQQVSTINHTGNDNKGNLRITIYINEKENKLKAYTATTPTRIFNKTSTDRFHVPVINASENCKLDLNNALLISEVATNLIRFILIGQPNPLSNQAWRSDSNALVTSTYDNKNNLVLWLLNHKKLTIPNTVSIKKLLFKDPQHELTRLCLGSRTQKCIKWGITETELLDILIEQGANINIHRPNESSLLIMAIHLNPTITKALLMRGAQGYVKGTSTTALHESIIHENNECFSIALRLCPNLVQHRNLQGNTALHLAARYNLNNDCTKALIVAGANILEENNQGQTPFDIAKENDNDELANLMLEWAQEHSKSSQ